MAGVDGLLLESFDTYGSGEDSIPFMLSGNAFAELLSGSGDHETCDAPAWGARTGLYCLKVTPTTQVDGAGARRVLDDVYTEQMFRFAFSLSALPSINGNQAPLVVRNNANGSNFSIVINTTGTISVVSGEPNGTVVATTTAPVVEAQTWHFFEVYCKHHSTNGEVVIYVDDPDTPVIDTDGVTMGASAFAQVVMCRTRLSSGNALGTMYMDDFIARKLDTPGTPVYWGDTRVATGFVNGDTDVDGWVPYPRKCLGTGILDTRAANNSAVSAVQSTDFNIGAADFTLELFVRFNSLLSSAGYQAICGKWTASGNNRSYQLVKFDPGTNDGHLAFRISTDGQAGTINNVISWPWEPDTDTWYYLTIQRESGMTSLYIDGILKGAPFADANTYAAISAPFGIGGEMSGTSTVLANSRLNGWQDEIRLTIGVARYSANFTPPTDPFPRDIGGDPYFASVVLLAGWDNGIQDESGYGRTLTARNSAAQDTPDDGAAAYQVINDTPPKDDTYVQAALLRAGGELTFNANAANTNTVTLGTQTYTFKTVLVGADDVLIGASASESIDNLVAAINGEAGEGTIYGTGTVANVDAYAEPLPGDVMAAAAIAAGTAGNSIATTSTLADGGWAEATLTGGVDIPGPSEYRVPRLPFDATVVRGISIVTRSKKTAAGDCTVQVSFVGPQGGSTQGADNSLTTNFVYRRDYFETDPDTAGNITPSTIAGARVRLDRTA